MRLTVFVLFWAVGLIHLLPLPGVLGGERLAMLYGIQMHEPNVVLLLRHRAVLFAIVGGLLIAAAFLPEIRMAALLAGGVSTVSFLALVPPEGTSAELRRVARIDVLAIGLLFVVAVIVALQRRSSTASEPLDGSQSSKDARVERYPHR